MNIFSNFISNRYVTFNDKDLLWMTNYLNYLKHVKRNCHYVELQRSIEEVSEDISKIKEQYYDFLAKKLNNPTTSPKTYCAIMKVFYTGKEIPPIPFLLVNDQLECEFGKKSNHFNESSVSNTPTVELSSFQFNDQDKLRLIIALHVNKTHGCDNLSIRLIKICDQSILMFII